MDKGALKSFAEYSREKLIEDVKAKARLIGIKEDGIESPLSESTNDMYAFNIGQIDTYRIYGEDVSKYEKLIKELERREEESDYKTAYETLVEEVAYTWFNRLIAIRFMEVNNYMPDRMRILSSGKKGVREPEFITYYRDTNIGIKEEEFEKLDELKLDASAQAMDKLFQFMFIKQCNGLNENLPELFEKTDDYAELLLNISYNDEEGVVYKLIEDVGEEVFDINKTGQIEVIGWLYQYYNNIPRDKVINIYKGNMKKEDIPAATQLFTTEWVVKYMVENSLGKYWLERNPNSKLRDHMHYLMPGEIERLDEKISPKDIKVFDNAMGSGHILIYAFDLLMKIYLEEGYMEREAAESIIENNLYGLDIDRRAYQLAYFALMMKGRKHNRRIFDKKIENNLRLFEDSIDIDKSHLNFMGVSMDNENRTKFISDLSYLLEKFKNAKEIGSILQLDKLDIKKLRVFINDTDNIGQITFEDKYIEITQKKLNNILDIAEMLTSKYHIMVTNPPYLNKMSNELKKYVNDNYPDYKKDLFSVFIYNNIEMCKKNGYSAYMTPNVWMFIKTYEKLRRYVITNKKIDSLIQIAKGAFYRYATVDVITFVIKNKKSNSTGKYIRLEDFKGDMEVQKRKVLEVIENPNLDYYYKVNQKDFQCIPGSPIAYWVSYSLIDTFKNGDSIINYSEILSAGNKTANNELFLKKIWEINYERIGNKWYLYSKGGMYRKWYGNIEYLINLSDDALNFYKNNKTSHIIDKKLWFKKGITYTDLTSANFSCRFLRDDMLFDMSGPGIILDKYLEYIMGFLNTNLAMDYFKLLNSSIHYKLNDIKRLPIIFVENRKAQVDSLVKENIFISKIDWDSFEISLDFDVHPLLDESKQGQIPDTVEVAYNNWKKYANVNFKKLKNNEEILNEIFIEIYGLEDELNPEVLDKNVTISKIIDYKNEVYEDIKGNTYILTKEDVIKSFISYGVGCIFGRYSLDEEGLVYAGGEFNINRYKRFKPVEDNIAIITDEEYFEDDLVNRFIDFVDVSFGEENLEKNLEFIADSLKGKGTPREKIRNYFVNDFFKDHVKIYKKTPIYWLYDSSSGKTKRQSQNGFKALIYMHRYDEDTTGKVRIKYLHRLQKVYENRIEFLRDSIAYTEDVKKVAKSKKELEKIIKQVKECKDYDEKIGHLALSKIDIDLDDGVKVNYEKVQTDEDGKKHKILAKI